MRVPTETHYEEGEKHVEDLPGFVLCTQCDKCPLNSEYTIRPDGKWKCYYFNEWRDGDDILEYKCEGYRQKSCATCEKKGWCDKMSDDISYCRSYQRKGIIYKIRDYYGRRRPLKSEDPKTIKNEMDYTIDKYRRLYEANYGDPPQSGDP